MDYSLLTVDNLRELNRNLARLIAAQLEEYDPSEPSINTPECRWPPVGNISITKLSMTTRESDVEKLLRMYRVRQLGPVTFRGDDWATVKVEDPARVVRTLHYRSLCGRNISVQQCA